jgi:hypothetical protein
MLKRTANVPGAVFPIWPQNQDPGEQYETVLF